MPLKQVAVIASAHGLAGEVYLISYVSNYLSLKDYSPLTDKNDEYDVIKVRLCGKRLIVKIKNINSRTEAEKLRNTILFTEENNFPSLDANEFFPSDLINMNVTLKDGTEYGTIKDICNFGAGEIVEISLHDSSKTILLPFTEKCFPIIDRNNAKITLVLPDII